MKKQILICLLVGMCSALLAQTNLREGYIITLQGDTLHGSIEYRTERINAERCVFIQDGSNEYKTYLPDDIQGYRFLDNGIYYVPRKVMVRDAYMNETPKTMFVQYVMRGKMSLLYAANENVAILEKDNGQSASFREFEDHRMHDAKERGKQLGEVSDLLKPSFHASSLLWGKENNLKNTKEVVSAYNDEICHDGICEIFEYKTKKKPKADRFLHPFVKVGLNRGKLSSNFSWFDYLGKYTSPVFTIGTDFHLNRLCSGLMVQAEISYNHIKSTGEFSEIKTYGGPSKYEYIYKYKTKAHKTDLRLGLAYQLTKWKLKPYVRAGYDLQVLIKEKANRRVYYPYSEFHNPSTDNSVEAAKNYDLGAHGYYAGIGLEYPLHKGAIVFDCNYNANTKSEFLNPEYTIDNKYFSCNLGYKF